MNDKDKTYERWSWLALAMVTAQPLLLLVWAAATSNMMTPWVVNTFVAMCFVMPVELLFLLAGLHVAIYGSDRHRRP